MKKKIWQNYFSKYLPLLISFGCFFFTSLSLAQILNNRENNFGVQKNIPDNGMVVSEHDHRALQSLEPINLLKILDDINLQNKAHISRINALARMSLSDWQDSFPMARNPLREVKSQKNATFDLLTGQLGLASYQLSQGYAPIYHKNLQSRRAQIQLAIAAAQNNAAEVKNICANLPYSEENMDRMILHCSALYSKFVSLDSKKIDRFEFLKFAHRFSKELSISSENAILSAILLAPGFVEIGSVQDGISLLRKQMRLVNDENQWLARACYAEALLLYYFGDTNEAILLWRKLSGDLPVEKSDFVPLPSRVDLATRAHSRLQLARALAARGQNALALGEYQIILQDPANFSPVRPDEELSWWTQNQDQASGFASVLFRRLDKSAVQLEAASVASAAGSNTEARNLLRARIENLVPREFRDYIATLNQKSDTTDLELVSRSMAKSLGTLRADIKFLQQLQVDSSFESLKAAAVSLQSFFEIYPQDFEDKSYKKLFEVWGPALQLTSQRNSIDESIYLAMIPATISDPGALGRRYTVALNALNRNFALFLEHLKQIDEISVLSWNADGPLDAQKSADPLLGKRALLLSRLQAADDYFSQEQWRLKNEASRSNINTIGNLLIRNLGSIQELYARLGAFRYLAEKEKARRLSGFSVNFSEINAYFPTAETKKIALDEVKKQLVKTLVQLKFFYLSKSNIGDEIENENRFLNNKILAAKELAELHLSMLQKNSHHYSDSVNYRAQEAWQGIQQIADLVQVLSRRLEESFLSEKRFLLGRANHVLTVQEQWNALVNLSKQQISPKFQNELGLLKKLLLDGLKNREGELLLAFSELSSKQGKIASIEMENAKEHQARRMQFLNTLRATIEMGVAR